MQTSWLLTDICLHKVISNNRVFSYLYPEESGRHNRFDDDNLPFDVFLTYAESDRHIMEQMYMDLTSGSRGRTFKCAVHDKDFVPGQSIGKYYEIQLISDQTTHKPYVNEAILRGQNLSSKYCQPLELLTY